MGGEHSGGTSSLPCSDFSTASLAMIEAIAPVSAPAYSAFRSCAIGTASVCTLQHEDMSHGSVFVADCCTAAQLQQSASASTQTIQV